MLIFLPFWLYKNKFFFFNLMTLDIIKKIKKICRLTTVRTQHNVSLPSDCFVQKLFLVWQRFFDVILKNYYELHFDLRFYVSLYDFTRPCQIYILFAGLFLATPAHEYSEGKKRGWWELGAKSSHQLTNLVSGKTFHVWIHIDQSDLCRTFSLERKCTRVHLWGRKNFPNCLWNLISRKNCAHWRWRLINYDK